MKGAGTMRSKALVAIVLLGAVASARGADVTISLSELEGTYGLQEGRHTVAAQDIDFLAAAGLQSGHWVAPWEAIPLQIHMTISADPSVVRQPKSGVTIWNRTPQVIGDFTGGWDVDADYLDPAEVLPTVTIADGHDNVRIEGTGDEYTIDQEVEHFTYLNGTMIPDMLFSLRLDLWDGATPRGISLEDLPPIIDSLGSVTISDAYIVFDGSLLAGTPLPEGDMLPEPTSLLLLAVLAPGVLRRKRR